LSKEYITQKELADIVGVKPPYITKLKNKGLFEHCYDGKKLIKKLAIQTYYDNEDPKREPQRVANENLRNPNNSDEISPAKKGQNVKPKSVDMFDVSYISEEAQIELNELIKLGKTAVHKIQIKDAFIESKKKENEFKKDLGVLIELEEAEALIELVSSNMKTKMYNVPHLLKSKYSKITKEQADYIYSLIDTAFGEFNKFGLDK
jgi:transcriptional regulator with XRE-family HTH domain